MRAFLSPPLMPQLLLDLLRQCAGLQLAFTQPSWDLLIPIYFGSPASAFDQSLVSSAVVLQIKNTKKKNTFTLGVSERNYLSHLCQPVLAIMLDLGTAARQTQSQYTNAPRSGGPPVWGIHIFGAGSEAFQVLADLQLGYACQTLLHELALPELDSMNAEIARLSARSNFLDIEDRFPGCFRKQDYDTAIEDSEVE